MNFTKLSSNIMRFCNVKPLYNNTPNAIKIRRLHDLNHAIKEAENVVGYNTSFLNLRWILNDELANIAIHLRRLITTNHPLLSTARNLFFGNTAPAWGLIVLLVSKAAGLRSKFADNEKDVTAGILHSQRVLAEVTEMIWTSHLIHKCVINVDETKHLLGERDNINFGNKITLLSGDFLLSRSFHELACLKNQNMNRLMSTALRDLVEATFFGSTNAEGICFPSRPWTLQKKITIFDPTDPTVPYDVSGVIGYPRAEWTLRNILGGASLLAKSCQAALMLADYPEEIQRLAFMFGKNVALAGRALHERAVVESGNYEMLNLVSAPIMLHIEKDPTLYEKIIVGKDNLNRIDQEEIRRIVLNGCALQDTKELQYQHLEEALKALKEFPCSNARTALENIIFKLKNNSVNL